MTFHVTRVLNKVKSFGAKIAHSCMRGVIFAHDSLRDANVRSMDMHGVQVSLVSQDWEQG